MVSHLFVCFNYDSFASVLWLLLAILFYFVVVCNDTPWDNNAVISELLTTCALWFIALSWNEKGKIWCYSTYRH